VEASSSTAPPLLTEPPQRASVPCIFHHRATVESCRSAHPAKRIRGMSVSPLAKMFSSSGHHLLMDQKDMLVMMSRGYVSLVLLDRVGQVGGSVEHSKGKDGESDVAILRFLCGSTRPCWLRTTPFWPRWQTLSCVLTTCRGFMGLGKPGISLTTSPNCTPYPKDVVGGGMRPRAKTSPVGTGSILT
jgi:hypothetical protein